MRTLGPLQAELEGQVLHHLRHQEHLQAVGTHYWPTQIYGPTGHAIRLQSCYSRAYLPPLQPQGFDAISDDYRPARGWPPLGSKRCLLWDCREQLADLGRSDTVLRGPTTMVVIKFLS